MRGSLADVAARLGSRAFFDVPLGPLTTYRVGGAARVFVKAETLEDLRDVADAVAGSDVALLVVGRGSNLLIADEGFEGLAVLLAEGLGEISVDSETVRAGGAAALPVLARRSVSHGLTGLEWAVGVPGSVGGGVRMNAGGHGSDIATTIVSAHVLDLRQAREAQVPADRLGLRFRGSDLADHQVVVSACFALAHGDRDRSEAELAEIVRWRREHQPGGQNAGSVFVNPVPGVLAAGQLVDELGLRGTRIGTAEVSSKHANFIQADEGGRAADVRAVMDLVRETVQRERGVLLRSEIRLVGFADTSPDGNPGIAL